MVQAGHYRRCHGGPFLTPQRQSDRGRRRLALASAVVELRRRTLLSLDDVLGCLRATTTRLTRSARHHCLVRHCISRLLRDEKKASKHGRFPDTAISYVHIAVCKLHLTEGKGFMSLAIAPVSKCTHVAFLHANTKPNDAAFLRAVVQAFPYRIHAVPTDNSMALAELPKNCGRYSAMLAIFGAHIFRRVCEEHGIEHRSTNPCRP